MRLVSNYTDVMSVRVVALQDIDDATIMVMCDFISGADAQGYMKVLVGEMDNTTVNITREFLCTTGIIHLTLPLSCHREVIGFDIEFDGSVGTLAVPGAIIINRNDTLTSSRCSPTTVTVKHPPRKLS